MTQGSMCHGKAMADMAEPPAAFVRSVRVSLALLVRAAYLTFLVLTVYWIMKAQGRLSFSATSVFGWHPLLLTLAFPILTVEAILAVATPFTASTVVAQATHIVLNTAAFICTILGLVAIAYFKHLSERPIVFPFYTLFSAHSWLGVGTVVMLVAQMAIGIYKKCPVSKSNPAGFWCLCGVHRFLGKATLAAALATCATGFQSMQSSDLAGEGYGPYSTYSLIAPAAAVLLLVLALAFFGVLELRPRKEAPAKQGSGDVEVVAL